MKIATWNVNSLKVRLPHVLDWLSTVQPDVLALQETKLQDHAFPCVEIGNVGYHAIYAGQKTYNGVALLSRQAPHDVVIGIPGFDDPQRRVLAASYGAVRVVNLYVPNGESLISEKYRYKLDWLTRLTDYIRDVLAHHPQLVVVGDFNIAPESRDVHDPIAWEGQVLCSEPERTALQALLAVGLSDVLRLHHQDAGLYSWWDYRQAAFRRNLGLRIDHILASPALCQASMACHIDASPRKLERPSDHAPVVAEFC